MNPTEIQSKSDIWAQRIHAFRLSGLPCKEWCEQNRISASTLRYWLHKQKMDGAATDGETIFAKLPSETEVLQRQPVTAPITMHLGCLRIEVSSVCPRELLSDLVGMLKDYA